VTAGLRERACRCPARPAATEVIPPASGRPPSARNSSAPSSPRSPSPCRTTPTRATPPGRAGSRSSGRAAPAPGCRCRCPPAAATAASGLHLTARPSGSARVGFCCGQPWWSAITDFASSSRSQVTMWTSRAAPRGRRLGPGRFCRSGAGSA